MLILDVSMRAEALYSTLHPEDISNLLKRKGYYLNACFLDSHPENVVGD